MTDKFLTQNEIFVQTTKLAELLIQSNGYEDFHNRIIENNLEYNEQKVYEIAQTGFFDFNQHLYENINEMNSISCGIYLEKSLITFRIFLWGAKGEGFEIFKHVLIGNEISSLNNIENIKEYIALHMSELESGIIKTYNKDAKKAFEMLGIGLEDRKLPLSNILQDLSIVNNISDFK